MSDLLSKLSPLVIKIHGLQKLQMDVYIHCSKLNDFYQVLKQIPQLLDQTLNQTKKKRKYSQKYRKAIDSILSVLDHVNELTKQCGRDTFAQFLLATSLGVVKKEVAQLREQAAFAFDQLKFPSIAAMLQISKTDLTNQDLVDMKRIAQILISISHKRRDDIKENLEKRFASLEQLGIECDKNDAQQLTIPELPPNMQLVVKHDDITIQREIGKGISGSVYLGLLKGKQVAVKVLHKRSLSPQELESFRREIFALSNVSHPALLKFCGYTDESPFYIITEYMENGSLFDVLRNKPNALNPTARSLIALDVARGLEFLHGRGVIHRDLKSLNVLLDNNFRAKICDFGMVRTQEQGPMTGLIGTVHWMAPEVLISSPAYDQKVDVYSYAIFLWELLTSGMPYKGLKAPAIIAGVIEGMRPPIPSDAPPKLVELIHKCWDNDPMKRPAMTRVVVDLGNKEFHFTGTDEALFASAAGVVGQHRTTLSQPFQHRRSRAPAKQESDERFLQSGLEIMDMPTLIMTIENSSGAARLSFLKTLFNTLSDKSAAEDAVKSGVCPLIVSVLNEQGAITEFALSQLLQCKCPGIFDVNVLKSLLNFSDNPDENMRSKALSVLICASMLRFDFLSSAPSFLLQLIQFFTHSLLPQQANSLLQLSRRLLLSFTTLPEGIVPILMQVFTKVPMNLQNPAISCIASAIRFDNGKEELTQQDFISILRALPASMPVIQTFLDTSYPCSNDKLFASIVFQARENDNIYQLLKTIAGNKRFASYIVALLPVGGITQKAASVYQPLLEYDDLISGLAEIPEFYASCSYFIANGKIALVANALKHCTIDPSIVEKSPLCSLVVEALKKTDGDDTTILLMSIIFSISSVMLTKEFVSIIPHLFHIMFNGDSTVRMPTFLAIAAISRHTNEKIDYAKLLSAAAFYVNCETLLAKKAAAVIISDHIDDPNIDVNHIISIFVEHYKSFDDYVKMALDSLMAVTNSKGKSIDSKLKKRLLAISETVA